MTTRPAGKKSFRTNLILAFILLVLCVFAYWFEFKYKKTEQDLKQVEKKLLHFVPVKDLKYVRIVNPASSQEVQLECTANCHWTEQMKGQWRLTKPFTTSADVETVNRFLSDLRNIQYEEEVLQSADGLSENELKKFGLQEGKRSTKKMTFSSDSESAFLTLYTGDEAPVGSSQYVAFTDNPEGKIKNVYTVPSHFLSDFEKKPQDWRDKKIFDFEAEQVAKIFLRNGFGAITMVKKGEQWWIEGQKDAKQADANVVESFLMQLRWVKASQFLVEDRKKDKLPFTLPQKPHYEVQLFDKDGAMLSTVQLYEVLAKKSPRLVGYRADRPALMELDRTHLDKFSKKENFFLPKKTQKDDQQ